MSNPLVSVIIPIYKTEQWLPKCINSCINQTYSNIEIILIDDGSPDNCGSICDKFAERDSRIVVLHQANSGVSSARNHGLKVARGEYIVFLDSDDWLNSNAIHELIKEINLYHSDLVVCGAYFFSGNVVDSELKHDTVCFSNQHDFLRNLLCKEEIRFIQTPWIKLFKKSIIIDNGIQFDTSMKLGEDLSFVLEYIRYVNQCIYINKSLFNIQQVTYNKNLHYQTSDIVFHWKNGIKLYNKYVSLFKKTGYYNEYSSRVDLFYLRMIKIYLNTTIMANAKKVDVLSKIKPFSKTVLYEKIISSDLKLVNDNLEKMILLCLKYKAFDMLYYLFYCKIRIYNRFYAKIKSMI